MDFSFIGFNEQEASTAISRLRRCGLKVGAAEIASLGRWRLSVEYPHNPGIRALVFWPEEVEKICHDYYHLPLTPVRPSADFRADGRYTLPGVS